MDVVDLALKGAVAPGAIALAFALLSRGKLGGLGVAAGLLTTFILLLGWPGFPPVDATHWTPFVALAGGLLGLWPRGVAPAGRHAAVGALLLVGAWLLLAPLAANLFGAGELLLLLAIVVTGVIAERATAMIGEGPAGRPGLLALSLVFAGMAAALGLSGTASTAQLAGAVAAGLGALFLLAIIPRAKVDIYALAPAVGVAYALFVGTGALYAELSPVAWALLAVAPLVVIPARSLAGRARQPLLGLGVAAALALVPVGAAAAIAAVAASAEVEATSAPTPSGAPGAVPAEADEDYGYE